MTRDMKAWLARLRQSPVKKALPILSFPAVQLMDISVRQLITDAALQAEGMRRIAERVDSAASVSLMDLSVEAECFGAQVRMSDTEVPTVIGRLVSTPQEAAALAVPPVGSARSGLYLEAMRRAVAGIPDRPVFAGMIGPFSLAGRLLDVTEIMLLCYEDPSLVHAVLEKATAFLIDYGRAYKETGAHGLILAEPLTGILSPALAQDFSEPYVRRIVEALQDDSFLVVYHNCGGGTVRMIDSILAVGAAAYHFGNAVDMADVLPHIPADVVAMGNIDPAGQLRGGTPASVREATLALLQSCGGYAQFVVSTGCDVPPMARWDNIDAFFAAVNAYYGR